MIRLVSKHLENNLLWDNHNRINELIIENQILFRNVIRDLNSDSDEAETKFLLVDDKNDPKVLPIDSSVEVIYNPYNLEFNSRQITTALLKLLSSVSTSEEYYLTTNKIKTEIVKYINELVDSENFGFEVEPSEFTISQIAKAVNLHVVSDEDDYVELLTDYMEAATDLAGVKIFVFINFNFYINPDEMSRLAENIKNHEFNALFIDGASGERHNQIPRITIDKDFCEL